MAVPSAGSADSPSAELGGLHQPGEHREPAKVTFAEVDDRIEIEGWELDATVRDLVEGIEAFRLAGTLRTARCAGCGECCYQRIPVFAEDLPLLARAVEQRGPEHATGAADHADPPTSQDPAGASSPTAGHRAREPQGAELSHAGRITTESPPEVLAQEVTSGLLGAVLELPERPDAERYRKGIADLARQFDLSPRDARLIYEYNNSEPIILARGADGACVFLRDGWCTIYDYRTIIGRLYVCNMAERFAVLEEQIVVQGTWHAYARLGWIEPELLEGNPFFETESAWDIPLSSFQAPSPESNPDSPLPVTTSVGKAPTGLVDRADT